MRLTLLYIKKPLQNYVRPEFCHSSRTDCVVIRFHVISKPRIPGIILRKKSMSRVQRGIFKIPHPDASGFGMTIVAIATQSRRRESSVGSGSWIPGQQTVSQLPFLSFRASGARHGIQENQLFLDTGLRRYDDFYTDSRYCGTVSKPGTRDLKGYDRKVFRTHHTS